MSNLSKKESSIDHTPTEFVYKESLANGLCVLTHEMPWAQSVTARLLVRAGPCYETPTTLGLAHFLEHMFFEGSRNYPTRRDLDRAVESRGGDHDAYTEKEYVMYQAKMPPENAAFTTKFLRELVLNPLMLDGAVEKEKGIIIEELKRAIDNPSGHPWNLLRKFVWGGHILAENTLGTEETIKATTRVQLLDYLKHFYTPDRMTLVISGNIQESEALDHANENFGDLVKSLETPTTMPLRFVQPRPRVLIENRDMQETQVRLAFSTEGHGESSPFLPAIQVLNHLLKKQIFHTFVYRDGLSYSASSWPWLFSDNGMIVVNFGVRPDKTEKGVATAIKVIRELEINEESLLEAKASLKKDLTLNLADTDVYANFIGEQALFRGSVDSPSELKNKIDAVNLETVVRLKSEIFVPERTALVVLGPMAKTKVEEFDNLLTIL